MCDKRFKNKSTQWIHMKIWSKNECSNVTFVTKHPRIVAPWENTQRFDPRIILILLADKLSRSLKGGFQQCHTCDITSKNSRTTRRHDDLIQEIYWYWFSLLQLWRFLEAALLPLKISFCGRGIILHVLRRIVLFLPHCHFLDAIQYKRLISLCDENRVSDWKLYPCYNLATNIGSHSNNCRGLHIF